MNRIIDLLDTITGSSTHSAVNPADIPCIEVSDPALLCKAPVVSVHIQTYNQHDYIASAIEGALNQKTNFEYEIVVGDDCSTDGTREICLEYQRNFPEKIRFLWSDENVYKYNGNEMRIIYRCRGDYIAYCEGDDYWNDHLKLQKQVDLLRKTNAVACVAFNDILCSDGSIKRSTYKTVDFLTHDDFQKHYFHTNTFVLKRAIYQRMLIDYSDISNWHSMMVMFCFSAYGKIALLPECTSVYRITMKGVATNNKPRDSHFLTLRAYVPLWLFGPRGHRGWYAVQALNQLVLLIRYIDDDSLVWFAGVAKEFRMLFWRLFLSRSVGIKDRYLILVRAMRAWIFRLFRCVPAFRKRCLTNQCMVFH